MKRPSYVSRGWIRDWRGVWRLWWLTPTKGWRNRPANPEEQRGLDRK